LAYLALTLQWKTSGGFAITNLQNLRTEIVLKDKRDVVFWFSISFRIATFRQGTGKRALPLTHQIRVRPDALFPEKRDYGEKISSAEDEARNND